MKLKNGFYIWKKRNDESLAMHPLNVNQVVQIIEDELWVTGMNNTFTIDEALKFGFFGLCVLETEE